MSVAGKQSCTGVLQCRTRVSEPSCGRQRPSFKKRLLRGPISSLFGYRILSENYCSSKAGGRKACNCVRVKAEKARRWGDGFCWNPSYRMSHFTEVERGAACPAKVRIRGTAVESPSKCIKSWPVIGLINRRALPHYKYDNYGVALNSDGVPKETSSRSVTI